MSNYGEKITVQMDVKDFLSGIKTEVHSKLKEIIDSDDIDLNNIRVEMDRLMRIEEYLDNHVSLLERHIRCNMTKKDMDKFKVED